MWRLCSKYIKRRKLPPKATAECFTASMRKMSFCQMYSDDHVTAFARGLIQHSLFMLSGLDDKQNIWHVTALPLVVFSKMSIGNKCRHLHECWMLKRGPWGGLINKVQITLFVFVHYNYLAFSLFKTLNVPCYQTPDRFEHVCLKSSSFSVCSCICCVWMLGSNAFSED